MKRKALIVLSGGQDSTTCALMAGADPEVELVGAIFFDYGQQHLEAEGRCAQKTANKLGTEFKVVDLKALDAVAITALTIPQGDVSSPHPRDHTLPSSFVPGRNLIMLTLAASWAYSIKANEIWTGVCQTDYSGYPDCRLSTIGFLAATINLGLGLMKPGGGMGVAPIDGKTPIAIETPLMNLSKAEIFQVAYDLGELQWIIENTHTGYTGNRSQLYSWGYGPPDGIELDPASKIRRDGFIQFLMQKNETNSN